MQGHSQTVYTMFKTLMYAFLRYKLQKLQLIYITIGIHLPKKHKYRSVLFFFFVCSLPLLRAIANAFFTSAST